MKKFKGSLQRQFKEGTLVDDHVPLKLYKRKKRKKIEPPKSNWEKFIDWIKNLFKK